MAPASKTAPIIKLSPCSASVRPSGAGSPQCRQISPFAPSFGPEPKALSRGTDLREGTGFHANAVFRVFFQILLRDTAGHARERGGRLPVRPFRHAALPAGRPAGYGSLAGQRGNAEDGPRRPRGVRRLSEEGLRKEGGSRRRRPAGRGPAQAGRAVRRVGDPPSQGG